MKKLLIIGAGIGQVPLLKKAQQRGIHVTVASIPGPYPCFQLADDVIYTNIYDRDAIVEEARRRGITAVTSDQNDLMMPTVAYVAEKLGLPGNSFDTVMTYCDKNRFRDLCDRTGVPGPRHAHIGTAGDVTFFNAPLPWMVKPADSQSSIGVKKVETAEQAMTAVHEALAKSPTHTAIVEEYVSGKEVVCEGLIDHGRYYPLLLGDRRYFDLPNVMIPSQTLFPSTLNEQFLERIIGYEQALTAASRPAFAIVHSEYLVNEATGDICIVESALRGGGVYISSDIVPMATGIDVTGFLLDRALGIESDMEAMLAKRTDRAAAYVCFYLPEGIIRNVSDIDLLKSFPFVKAAYIEDVVIGKGTEPPTYKGARKGPILVSGKDREELENNIHLVQQILQAEVTDGTETAKGIVWE